jgi:cellulose synthase/poly-beta-1,6-N-acetylglucosamine synthase-like glycosyltransferase
MLVAFCEMDQEVDMVMKDFESIKAIRSPEFMLAGSARNLGAQYAHGDVLAFVDSDCILDSNWVTEALQTIRAGAVLCSGTILDAYPSHLICSSDNRLQYVDFPAGRPYGRAAYFPGAHIIVKREIFESSEGFSNREPAEDILFTMSIALQFPQKIIFNPKIVASHAGRRTWKGLLEHHYRFGYSRAYDQIQLNETIIFVANYPWLGWILFLRRFIYITLRVVQWNLSDLLRYALQLPFISAGLIAWTYGFYQGIKERNKEAYG